MALVVEKHRNISYLKLQESYLMDVEVRLLYVPSLSRCVFNSFWYTFIVDLRLLPVNKRRFVFSYGATLCDKVPGSRNEGRGRGSRGGGKRA